MSNNSNRTVITAGSNILLALYLIYAGVVSYLFSPKSSSQVPMDELFKIAPITAIIAAIILALAVVLVGALAIRTFWNRLVTSLFLIREINYQEALAIMLMITIIFEK